ncbi:MAG TPA: DUF922 domain-containing protein [Burkholderiaceae bacterium]
MRNALPARLVSLALASTILGAPAACANVQADLEYRTYHAYAERGKSLYQVLASATPFHGDGRPFLGNTRRDIHWQLQWRDTGRESGSGSGVCRVTEVHVTLHTTITLPQLAGVDSERQAEYMRFYSALRIHEYGHYRIEQEMASEIDRALASLPDADCSAIESAANARGKEIVGRYNLREQQYDADTGHGKTQGAYLRN